MKNPVEEFLEMKKTAGGIADFFRAVKGKLTGAGMGEFLAPAIASAGVAATGLGLKAGYDAIREKLTRQRDYKMMLDNNPQLRGMDAKQVNMVYGSLRRLSPTMARDPLIAGSFVYKTISLAPESGLAIDSMTAKTISETQRNIQQAKSSKTSVYEAMLGGLGRQMPGLQASYGTQGPQFAGLGAAEAAQAAGMPMTGPAADQQRMEFEKQKAMLQKWQAPETMTQSYGVHGPMFGGPGSDQAAAAAGLPTSLQEARKGDLGHARVLEKQRIGLQPPMGETEERRRSTTVGPGGEVTRQYSHGVKGPKR